MPFRKKPKNKKTLGFQRKRTPPPPPSPSPPGSRRPPAAGRGTLLPDLGWRGARPRPSRAPVAMGTHSARPPEGQAPRPIQRETLSQDGVGEAAGCGVSAPRRGLCEAAPLPPPPPPPPPPPLRRRLSARHCASAKPPRLAGTAARARSASCPDGSDKCRLAEG